jgi:hypothetical protein
MPATVIKENGKTLKQTFENIFKSFGGVSKGRIFIKPNFSGRPPLIAGENTDPIFLKKSADSNFLMMKPMLFALHKLFS